MEAKHGKKWVEENQEKMQKDFDVFKAQWLL